MEKSENTISTEFQEVLEELVTNCHNIALADGTMDRTIFEIDRAIQKLVIYITRNNHKVWNDGYQKGKRDGKKEAKGNTNQG